MVRWKQARGMTDELASSWPTEEVENGGVVVDINNLPSSADAFTVIESLLFCERYWRSQKKKVIWLKLPSTYYNKLLHPALRMGFSIHRTEPTYAMLFLRLEEDEPSALPANASNQVGAGPCVGSSANLQQVVIDPDQCRSTLGQSQGRLGHQSDPIAIMQLHGHGNLVAAETGGIRPVSGLAADLVPADIMGNEDFNTEADNHGIEVINVSGPTNQTRRRALTPGRNSAGHTKRSRRPNWTYPQKHFLLKSKLLYQEHLKRTTCKPLDSTSWFDFVSKSYLVEHGISIEPGKWQDQMDTLLKQFNVIRAYEKMVQSGTTACVSFWKPLNTDDRSLACRNGHKNLPLIFDLEMYQLVEKIIYQIPEENPEETRDRQAGALGESSSQAMTATISESAGPSAGNRPSSCPREFQVSTESPLPFNDISPDTQGSLHLKGKKLDLLVNPLRQRSTPPVFDADAPLERIAPLLKVFALYPLEDLDEEDVPGDGTNEHRSQANFEIEVNVDTKLKGEPAQAIMDDSAAFLKKHDEEDGDVKNEVSAIVNGECGIEAMEEQTGIVQMDADLPSSADSAELLCDESDSETEEFDIPSEDEGWSGESAASRESQADVTSDSHVPQTEPGQNAGRQRSAASAFGEDDLIAKVSSFVNKQIEVALQPLMCAWRSRDEDEQRRREKMLAIENEKCALIRIRRQRDKNWSVEEYTAVLKSKEEGLEVVVGKYWEYISKRLEECYGFSRGARSCEDVWGTLLKRHTDVKKDIQSKNLLPNTSGWANYWKTGGNQQSENKLLRVFTLECYEIMERILGIEPRKKSGAGNKLKQPAVVDAANAGTSSTNPQLLPPFADPSSDLQAATIAPSTESFDAEDEGHGEQYETDNKRPGSPLSDLGATLIHHGPQDSMNEQSRLVQTELIHLKRAKYEREKSKYEREKSKYVRDKSKYDLEKLKCELKIEKQKTKLQPRYRGRGRS